MHIQQEEIKSISCSVESEPMNIRLYKAATSGNIDLIKDLVEGNPNLLQEETPLGNNVLHLAAKFRHEDLVKEVYLMRESLLPQENSKGDTALHIAARAGDLSIVNFLVEKSISLSASTSRDVEGGSQTYNILRYRNVANNTVLHEALLYHHSEVGIVLAEQDPGLWSIVNEAGESPLYLAAKGGHKDIVRQVLESTHQCNCGGPNRLTALHAATILDNYAITELLVKNRPELIKERDILGRTALHYAASYGRLHVAELLLESDTSVAYIVDEDGKSPLHFAAGNGNLSITEKIIEWYPDAVDLVDNNGQNAIHFCISNYKHVESYNQRVLDYFTRDVRYDQLLNQRDKDGNTPLHLAVIRCSPNMVRSILKHQGGLDINATNKDGMTPLDLAISPGKRATSKKEYVVYSHLNSVKAKGGIRGPLLQQRFHLEDARKVEEEYISRRKEIKSTQMVVATLIATVTFAAAYQTPGGYRSDGQATLAREAAFQAFVITDAIAFTCSMTCVFFNFIIPLIRYDFSAKFIPYGTILILISIISMFVAFAAALYVVLNNSLWLAIFTCFIVSGIYLLSWYFVKLE
ncbi:hypothetical protein HHK36_020039 [Tetracentron sinense]|uniref:PGG domain-containing protein n=1 Tax=Tetracentron sinense TaxID=13715 RepID=A0A835D8G9_TETSI|nr:hypothetical protein HHK36_020039 [Tetracentron sinense]